MSHGHSEKDSILEHVKSFALVLGIIDCIAGVLLVAFPLFTQGVFLYTSAEPLPTQMLGAACLACGVMMLLVRHYNRSTYRLILDMKICIGSFTLIAVLFNLFFSQTRWTLLLLVIAIIAITGVAIYLRRLIPRDDAIEDTHHADVH